MMTQDEDVYVSAVESDGTVLGQFVDAAIRGSPPASKTVVENLPLVAVTEDDLHSGGGVCAVCKDELSVGEVVKTLPCLHYYHGDCILPWLEIRNSCPVCRFELPTDDMDYERSRVQSGAEGGGSVSWDPQYMQKIRTGRRKEDPQSRQSIMQRLHGESFFHTIDMVPKVSICRRLSCQSF